MTDSETDTPTPITDREVAVYDHHKKIADYFELVPAKFARQLERELAAAKAQLEWMRNMSTAEMMCNNLNINHHVTEWETRAEKAEAIVDEG